MASNADYFAVNQQAWDEMTRIHLRGSDCYPIEQFRQGRCVLREIDVREVGDVSGKRLLHLQCHFGMDTLSWARRGAQVTGVDLSPEAIRAAQSLAGQIGVQADFVCCNLYDLREHLQGRFDIVYTSYGALCWLPDLDAWARLIAHYLEDGGFFHIAEGHPLLGIVKEQADGQVWLKGDYFDTGRARFDGTDPEPDYANPECMQTLPEYEWRHTLGEIVTALASAGLRIEFLHEYRKFGYDLYNKVEQPARYPKLFTLKATRMPRNTSHNRDSDTLIAEALAAPFEGWDFSWLEGRKSHLQMPWDYAATVKAGMSSARTMLDMGTGGGEVLASLAPFPPRVCATESYPPNVVVARRRLEPLGVAVFDTSSDPRGLRLPFGDAEFDLVINRHEEYIPAEVFRILTPGGRFVTQQCGGYGEVDLIEYFRGKIEPMDWTAAVASRQLEQAGFEIIDCREAWPEYSFSDIGAVVYYLKACPWMVEDFCVQKYRSQLLAMHEHIQQHGRFTVRDQRFLLEARKTA